MIFGLITIQCVLSASILITNFESLTPHPFNIYLKSIPYLAAYLPAIFFAYAFVLSVLYPSNTGQVNQFLGKLSQKTTLLIGFLIVTINGLAATYLYVFPSGVYLEKNSPLLDIYQAIFFPTIIFILISSELLIYIININKPDWKTLVADKDYRRLGITFLILFFTFLYWELLLLQTRKISYLPHWLSPIATRPITNHFLFIIPFTLLIIFVVKHAHLEKTLSSSKKLLLLLFFGLAAQFFFGFLSGEGLKSIQRFYFEQPISTSALYGCQHSNILDLIRNYDQYRGQDFFTKTKPPGFLTLHVIFAKLVKSITGVHDNQTCKLLYSQYGSVIFPFISALSLIPITYISKKVFKLESPYLPGILYSLMPNYMLWVMVPDQVIFPLIFLLNIILFYQTIHKKSFGLAFISGITFYLSTFITYSILPAVGIMILWLAIKYLDQKIHRKKQGLYQILLGFVFGVGVLYFIFLFLLDYDAISRYKLSFSSHRGIKDYSMELEMMLTSSVINTTEFFTWTGIPLFFLFADYFFRSIKKLFNHTFKEKYILTICTVGVFIALNVFGQTIGEVQRLWIFLGPLIAMISTADLERITRARNSKKVLGLLLLQLTTAVFHFYFLRNEWP